MKAASVLALAPLAMAAPQVARRAPLLEPRGENVQTIPGSYIIKLKDGSVADSAVSMFSGAVDKSFKKLNGFAAKMTDDEVKALQAHGDVEYIEKDAKVWAFATQDNADWGLARLSNKEAGSTTYTYDESAGADTCSWIVDTGIDIKHKDFDGRAKWAYNAVDNDDTDGNGHGTHTAGTVGSTTYGVAKKTNLFAVKVLDASGSGTNSGIIDGMEWVAENAPKQSGCSKGNVANMSLGGSKSAAVNQAAAAIVEANVFLAVAAGNGNALGVPQDSAGFSPASEPTVCTVGASDENDKVASFSNFGALLDVYAPGVSIESTWPDQQTKVEDGTSMASPHIAGLGAYFLGTGDYDIKQGAEGLCDFIAGQSLTGVISGVPNGTANALAQNGEA